MELLTMIGFSLALFGLLVIALGFLIWKKKLINLVSVHSDVQKKDIAAFTQMVGYSTIGIGISLIALGFFSAIFQVVVGMIIFGICFIISMAIYFKAQSKYD